MKEFTPTDVAALFGRQTRWLRGMIRKAALQGITFPGIVQRGFAGARPNIHYTQEFVTAFEQFVGEPAMQPTVKPSPEVPIQKQQASTVTVNEPDYTDSIIGYLKKRTEGVALDELADEIDLSPKRTMALVNQLIEESAYSLRMTTYGDVKLSRTPIAISNGIIPQWSGSYTQRFGVVSDAHWGNIHAKVRSMQRAYDYFEKQGCQFVINVGDLFDGSPNMHPGFVFELALPTADEQLYFAVEEYPSNLPTIIIPGNHCLSFYKDNGYDIVHAFVNNMRRKYHSDSLVQYAGVREAFLAGPDGYPNTICLKHPSGGKSYAKSHKVQKAMEWMHTAVQSVADDFTTRLEHNYPRIVFLGHFHSYCHILGPQNSQWFMLPSMCEMTAWMRDGMLYNEMGFLMMDVTFDDNGQIYSVVPRLELLPPGDEIVYGRAKQSPVMVSMDGLWR